MEKNALFKLSYGLYVLGVNDGNKPNGRIINTLYADSQVILIVLQ